MLECDNITIVSINFAPHEVDQRTNWRPATQPIVSWNTNFICEVIRLNTVVFLVWQINVPFLSNKTFLEKLAGNQATKKQKKSFVSKEIFLFWKHSNQRLDG